MSLPAPHLDDRDFQSLVDDAKRMVQQRCPEWTDHNVSDPGVTLIETFAYMVDQLLWRLNRVPERNYVKFLELIGMRLRPPSAARAPVTFWLTAAQPDTITVPRGTKVETLRADEAPVVFSVIEPLDIIPCSRTLVATEIDGTQVDHTAALDNDQPVLCFDRVPKPGDAFYVGLSNAVPGNAVTLELVCSIEGVGVDPRYPPLVWEAWNGAGWAECELERDTTGGLNRNGEVVLHVPETHRASAGVVKMNAGWLRCRVLPNQEWQPAYTSSPRVHRATAWTSGGTTVAVNAELVRDEIVGISEGIPAQRFPLQHRPVVPGEAPYILEVSTLQAGWEEWLQVEDFSGSAPEDQHFLIEETSGTVVFGPAVRQPDGTLSGYGKVPDKGLPVRVREYRTGGGRRGNVARGALALLSTPMPFIRSVTNRQAAHGGTDGEDIENAKLRGPILLKTRHRAVTAEDYEHLALQAAADVGRARCVPAGGEGTEAGGVRVLIVPRVEDGPDGALEFSQLVPHDDVYERVRLHIDERRTLGARVVIEPPGYMAVSIVAALRAVHRYDPRQLEQDARRALYAHFHPLTGGPAGTGWPFGRAVVGGEVFAVLQRVRGVDFVEDIRLFPADPVQRTRGERTERIQLGPNDLAFSYDHQVMVRPG